MAVINIFRNHAKYDQRVDQYVLGQLDDDELEDFEIFLMDNPEYIEQIEITEKLVHGLSHVSLVEPVSEQSGQTRNNDRSLFRTTLQTIGQYISYPVPAWSLATAIMAVVLPATLVFNQQSELTTSPQSDIAMLTVYPSGMERGSAIEQVLVSPESNQRIILSLLLYKNTHRAYHFQLLDAAGKTEIWQSDEIMADFSDSLHIDMGIGFLTSGHYAYRITGVEENGNTSEVVEGKFQLRG